MQIFNAFYGLLHIIQFGSQQRFIMFSYALHTETVFFFNKFLVKSFYVASVNETVFKNCLKVFRDFVFSTLLMYTKAHILSLLDIVLDIDIDITTLLYALKF